MEKKGNRKYRDSVFVALFSDNKRAIELYNAIEGKNYPLDSEIEINTLDDALYLDRINDVSFVLDGRLVVLIEQQSTINLNMPLRFLQYINKIYERIIARDELNIYRTSLLKIPRPEFICLYNGKDNFPDEKILKLSDAYESVDGNEGIHLDLSVRVLNINEGKNESFVKESKALFDYVTFISRIRKNLQEKLPLRESIDEAVKYCLEKGVLEDFLKQYRSEVINMLTTEFDMEKAWKAWQLDGFENGFETGFEDGFEDGFENGVEKGIEKGIEQGVEKTETRMALSMLKQNYHDSEIISLLGITAEKLLTIKRQAMV